MPGIRATRLTFQVRQASDAASLLKSASHRVVLLWRHHSADRTRRWSRHDRHGPGFVFTHSFSSFPPLVHDGTPLPPPGGILRVSFLYPTVCRGLMAAKYS